MSTPLITLLTDFGLTDHYVGAMKGVICGICPPARIVDITHSVPAYGIAEAAYLLSHAAPCFPAGTIHVVVVDPGVGSARRPVLVQAGGQYFIGPDNGLFRGVARHLTDARYFRHPVSRTFHGRDIFAPVAAHLASGVPAEEFGPLLESCAPWALAGPERVADDEWTGTVLHVDHFGNIVTNLSAAEFRRFRLHLGVHSIEDFAMNYADAPAGPFLIAGSGGYWEISANQASAAELLNARAGQTVRLRLLVPQDAGVSGA